METKNSTLKNHRKSMDPGAYWPFVHKFLDHLRTLGHSPATVGFYSGSIRHFTSWLGQTNIALVDVDDGVVQRFSNHRCRCHGSRQSGQLGVDYINRVRRFIHFLEKLGIVPAAPEPPTVAIDRRIAEFQSWMRRHRGTTESTANWYGRMLMQLLPALGGDPDRYTASLLRDAFLHYCHNAASRHYPRMMATALRSYLRFLAIRGDCLVGLDHTIPVTKHWRLSALPRYLSTTDIERLIASCNLSQPSGIRDRAILLLLARLGLRAGDVSTLRLRDIEWDHGTLRVLGKGRRVIRLPLPQDAGDALLDYLTRARPAAAIDIVFLRLLPPYKPFATSTSISCVVDRALKRAGITNAPSRGTNLLRHSAATAMLRGGATLEAIGTVLRHRSIDTTAHYAKVDLSMLSKIAQPCPSMAVTRQTRADLVHLRRLAQPWPGGLPC